VNNMGGNIIFMPPNAQKNYQENQNDSNNNYHNSSTSEKSPVDKKFGDNLFDDEFPSWKECLYLPSFFLWWCAGVNIAKMRMKACSNDRVRYACAGLSVLLVSIVGFGVMSYVLLTVFKAQAYIAFPIAFLYGVYIFNADRMFLSTFRKEQVSGIKSSLKDFTSAVPRLFFALVICLFTALIMDTVAFDLEVSSVMDEKNIEMAKRRAIKAIPKVDELNEAKEEAKQQLSEKEEMIEIANENYIGETKGKSEGKSIKGKSETKTLSGIVGEGKNSRLEKGRMDRYIDEKVIIEGKIKGIEAQIEEFRPEWEKQYNTFLVEERSRNGLAARMMALRVLRQKYPVVDEFAFLLLLFLTGFEMLPILIKILFFPRITDYEKILDFHSQALDKALGR
jgi:hypothetical protein